MSDVSHYLASPGFTFVVFGVRGEGGNIVRGDGKRGNGRVKGKVRGKGGWGGRNPGVLMVEVVGNVGLRGWIVLCGQVYGVLFFVVVVCSSVVCVIIVFRVVTVVCVVCAVVGIARVSVRIVGVVSHGVKVGVVGVVCVCVFI